MIYNEDKYNDMTGRFKFSSTKYINSQVIQITCNFYDIDDPRISIEAFKVDLNVIATSQKPPSFITPLTQTIQVKNGTSFTYVLPKYSYFNKEVGDTVKTTIKAVKGNIKMAKMVDQTTI